MGKFYAVAKGKSGEGKIYDTWDKCKKDVIGFKGAIYKSFPTLLEAEDFLEAHGVKVNGNDFKNKEEKKSNEDRLEVYVDGSFNLSSKEYSYGLIALFNGNVIYEENGKRNDEAVAMRNVAGEVLGAIKAVEFAKNNGYKSISIYFDYQGIESWAKGTWKRNNFLTQGYNEFIKENLEEIDIKFIKVKGHSGDTYNDRADILAKKALGIV